MINPFANAVPDSAVDEFLSVVQECVRESELCPAQAVAAKRALTLASCTDALAGGPFTLLVFNIADQTGLVW